jgi:hypothetical protein
MVDDQAGYEWVAAQILPHEGELFSEGATSGKGIKNQAARKMAGIETHVDQPRAVVNGWTPRRVRFGTLSRCSTTRAARAATMPTRMVPESQRPANTTSLAASLRAGRLYTDAD